MGQGGGEVACRKGLCSDSLCKQVGQAYKLNRMKLIHKNSKQDLQNGATPKRTANDILGHRIEFKKSVPEAVV